MVPVLSTNIYMGDTPTRKRGRGPTTQLGWRVQTSILDGYLKACAEQRKDPVLELEYLMTRFLEEWDGGSKR